MTEEELVAALTEAWERTGGESATQSALSAYLRDRLGADAVSNVHLLVNAFGDGVPQRIKKTGPALWTVNRTVIAKSFSEQSGIALDRAQWAVDTWARAISNGAVYTNATVPQTPAAETPAEDQQQQAIPRPEQPQPTRPETIPAPKPNTSMRNFAIGAAIAVVLIAGWMYFHASSQRSEISTDVAQGDEARKNSDYSGAVSSYQKAIDLDPKSFDAWYGKGAALSNMKKYPDAISALQTAVSLNPRSSDAYDWLGYSLGEVEKNADALTAYKAAIAIDANDGYALTGASNAARNLNQYPDAEQYGQRAAAAKPQSSTAWSAYCRGAYTNGSYKAAYTACQQAAKYNSNDALVYSDYGWAMLRGKHPVTFSKLMSLYKQSMRTDDTVPDGYAGLGVIDFCQQNFGAAVDRFQAAKKRASNWPALTGWLSAAQAEYNQNGNSSTMSVTERSSSDDTFASIYEPFCTKIDIHV